MKSIIIIKVLFTYSACNYRNIQRASLKQTRGCGSLCWCYHSNTLTALCFWSPCGHTAVTITDVREKIIFTQLTLARSERWEVIEGFCRWTENDDTLHCSSEPASAAVRRSSNTSADLPTDVSGFTVRWLSSEGERWFASLLWYFQRWQEQHTKVRQRYRLWRHLRQTSLAWICQSTLRRRKRQKEESRETACPFDLLMCFPQVKQRKRDCISCCWWLPAGWLLADTADWYNVIQQQQRHSKSVWNAAVSPPGGVQRASTMQSVWEDCPCHCRLEVSLIRFTFTPKHE